MDYLQRYSPMSTSIDDLYAYIRVFLVLRRLDGILESFSIEYLAGLETIAVTWEEYMPGGNTVHMYLDVLESCENLKGILCKGAAGSDVKVKGILF